MKKIFQAIETLFIIIISLPVIILPLKIALKVGGGLGVMCFYILKKRRNIAIENVKNVIDTAGLNFQGSPNDLIKANFRNYGKSIIEIIKIFWGLGGSILNNVEIRGLDNYYKAKSRQVGILLITGHCGNWELLTLTVGVKIKPVLAIARRQDNPYINKIIEVIRQRYNNRIIYKEGALKTILSESKDDWIILIAIDQSVFKKEGYMIDFLGRKAWTTKVPVLIAKKTGVAMLPMFIHRERDKHILDIYPEIEVLDRKIDDNSLINDTKRVSVFVEEYIRHYPTEWLWIHRRWKRT